MVCWTTNCSQFDLVWNTVAYSANTRPRHSNRSPFWWKLFLTSDLKRFFIRIYFLPRERASDHLEWIVGPTKKNSNLRRFFVRLGGGGRQLDVGESVETIIAFEKTRHFLPQSCFAITISTSLSGWHPFCWSHIDAHWFSLNCRNLVESLLATIVIPHLQNKPLADFDWHPYQTHIS